LVKIKTAIKKIAERVYFTSFTPYKIK